MLTLVDASLRLPLWGDVTASDTLGPVKAKCGGDGPVTGEGAWPPAAAW